jgi:hypothetical protein
MTEIRMTEAAQKRVIRLNLTFAWIFAGFFGLVQAPLYFMIGNWGMGSVVLFLAIAMVAFTYLLANRMVRNSRIVFGDGTYTVYGTGRTKRFSTTDVARVVTIDRMSLGAGVAGSTHHLIVVGPVTRLLILVGQMWDTDQLSTLALDLANRGVPLTPIPRPITPVQLRAYDARLMPSWQAHPIAFALIVALGTVVIITIVVVLALVLVFPPLFGY